MSDYLLSFNDEDCLFPFNGVKPVSVRNLSFSSHEKESILKLFKEDGLLSFESVLCTFTNVPKEVMGVLKRTVHSEDKEIKAWFNFFNLIQSKLNKNECCQLYIHRDEIVFIDGISKTADVDLLCITKEEIKLYKMEYAPTTAY